MEKVKKLYLISQEINNAYDTYDSAVVVATSPKMATTIHPHGLKQLERDSYGIWTTPENVKAEFIGFAKRGIKLGTVICASFIEKDHI